MAPGMTPFMVFFGLSMLCGYACLWRISMRGVWKPANPWDGALFGASVAFFLSLWLHVALSRWGAGP